MTDFIDGLKRKLTEKRWELLKQSSDQDQASEPDGVGTDSGAIQKDSKVETKAAGRRLALERENISRDHETRRLKLALSSIHFPVVMLTLADMMKHFFVQLLLLCGVKVTLPWLSVGQIITELLSMIPAVGKAIKEKNYKPAFLRFFIYALITSALITGFVVSVAVMETVAPILFGIAFSIMTVLSIKGAWNERKEHKKNPWKAKNTLARLTRNSRNSKAIVFSAVLPLLFMFFFVPGAQIPLGFSIVGILGVFTVSRVIKHYQQRKHQVKLIKSFVKHNVDPYKVLGIDRDALLKGCKDHREYRWKIKEAISEKYKALAETAREKIKGLKPGNTIYDTTVKQMSIVERAYQLLRKDAIRKSYDTDVHLRTLALDPEFRMNKIMHYGKSELGVKDCNYDVIHSFRKGWRYGFTPLMRIRVLYKLHLNDKFSKYRATDSGNAQLARIEKTINSGGVGRFSPVRWWRRRKAIRKMKDAFLSRNPKLATVEGLLKRKSGFKRWGEICQEIEDVKSPEATMKISEHQKREFLEVLREAGGDSLEDCPVIRRFIGMESSGKIDDGLTLNKIVRNEQNLDKFDLEAAIKGLSSDDRIALEQLITRYCFSEYTDGAPKETSKGYVDLKTVGSFPVLESKYTIAKCILDKVVLEEKIADLGVALGEKSVVVGDKSVSSNPVEEVDSSFGLGTKHADGSSYEPVHELDVEARETARRLQQDEAALQHKQHKQHKQRPRSKSVASVDKPGLHGGTNGKTRDRSNSLGSIGKQGIFSLRRAKGIEKLDDSQDAPASPS